MDVQEAKIYTAIIIAVLVTGTIVCYFFYSIIRQHRKVISLQRQNATAQITALEKDRSRIATDLHDEVAPMLVAVRMKINSLDIREDADQKHLLSANTTIDEIAKRMRSIAFDLMPATLQSKGLVEGLREFINSVTTRDGLQIRLAATEQPFGLSEAKTIHLYRIVQEIIHNTIKHSAATELTIVVRPEEGSITVGTRDNGCGFDYPQKLTQGTGLGLRSLLNRVHLLDGKFLLESKPGKGTAISIQIPTQND